MKAMILAAGRGERLRPLTDTTPKPLLQAGGRALIEWQIAALVAGGFDELVINHAWLGALIEAWLGDGSRYGARIRYSPEQEALETLGGITKALPLLGDQPFVVVSADIHTDYDYARLTPIVHRIAAHGGPIAHLVLTDNPPYNPSGDMALIDGPHGARIAQSAADAPRLNYGNIGVFHPRMFTGLPRGQKQKLFPWVYRFQDEPGISGEHFRGAWHNIGTAGQLAALDEQLRHRRA